jgi:ribosomal protein S18 acetylase RimI-like enzyme
LDGHTEAAEAQFIADTLRDNWGLPVVTVARDYMPEDVDGGLIWRDGAGEAQGLVTWAIDGGNAEIVTLDAFMQGVHIGGRLLDAAEAELEGRGVRRLSITTTNDNLRALAFYVRRGYRLVRLDLDGVDRVRAAKPGVPATGADGIPLRDMWELEKNL